MTFCLLRDAMDSAFARSAGGLLSTHALLPRLAVGLCRPRTFRLLQRALGTRASWSNKTKPPSESTGLLPQVPVPPRGPAVQVLQSPVPPVPWSQAPVSQVPVSQAPVSQAPVSQVPVSQVPVSQVPVSPAPVSQVPAQSHRYRRRRFQAGGGVVVWRFAISVRMAPRCRVLKPLPDSRLPSSPQRLPIRDVLHRVGCALRPRNIALALQPSARSVLFALPRSAPRTLTRLRPSAPAQHVAGGVSPRYLLCLAPLVQSALLPGCRLAKAVLPPCLCRPQSRNRKVVGILH